MIVDRPKKVEIEGAGSRVSKLTVDGQDVLASTDRANIILDSDGSLKMVMEVPISELSTSMEAIVEMVPTLNGEVFKQFMRDFLNTIDPDQLEESALNNLGWDSSGSTTAAILAELRKRVDGLSI